jgi:flagellar biosynthesis protein FlhF
MLPAGDLAEVLSRLAGFGPMAKQGSGDPDKSAAKTAAAIRAALANAPKIGSALDKEEARDLDEERDAASEFRAPRTKDPSIEAIVGRLCATGLNRDLAERIARDVPRLQRRNGSIAAIEKSAATHLAPLAAGDEGYAPVELFVGPPGAGKTTTIAKIAAQERARRGARLNLLAADGFRVGAVEQLRIYADIIGTPFSVARTPADIEQSLLGTRGPVLVDTAGRSARDPRAHEVVSMLSSMPGVRTHLVVPAAATVRDVNRVLDIYGDKSPGRVVLTRVDEAESVSPLMQIFQERGLMVSYIGTGQRVPDDLERATPERLAAHVLGNGLPQGTAA